ncbi:hypothetical protein VSQ48_20180 [Candidatus Ventrimonas sp. KK005]
MARFKPSLMDKVEKEHRQEIKQEKLKAESGIKEEEVLVKEKSGSDYGKAIFRFVVYVVLGMLAFVGIMVVLSPEARGILIEWFRWP